MRVKSFHEQKIKGEKKGGGEGGKKEKKEKKRKRSKGKK